MLSEIPEFINRYYVDPIVNDAGYNIVNTLTWAAVLAICVYILYALKLFRRLDIAIDQRFAAGVICYVLFGSSLRVIEDADIFTPPIGYLFITPVIYFVVFFVTLAALLLSIKIYGSRYLALFAAIGIGLTSVNVGVLLWHERIAYPAESLLIIALTILITALIYVGAGFAKIAFLRDRLNVAILGAHLFDASSTTVGIDLLNYHGKHVVENYLIDLTGTGAVMYPLKLLVFIPLLYLVDDEFDEAELRDLLKLVILVLGLSPACRNTLRILFGV